MGLKDKFKILTYNIGLIEKGTDAVIEEGLVAGDIRWLKHSYKDRFFADPFLVKEDDGKYYVVCEELSFWNNKGIISLLVINKRDFSLLEKKTLIEEPWHLSFPYIINNEYLLPESHKGGKAYLYHINVDAWEIDKKTLVCDECGFVDPIIIQNTNVNNVLLSTDNSSEKLYAFKMGDDNKYHQISQSPLMIDKSRTRAAGNTFQYKESLVRPVQDCVQRYGRQTRIVKADLLDDQTYQTEDVAVLNSDSNPPYDETFHTFNVYDNCIIVDGSKDFVRFPMKIFYRISTRLKQ